MNREQLKKQLNKKAKGAALDEALDLLEASRAAGADVANAAHDAEELLQMLVAGNTVVPDRRAPAVLVGLVAACVAFDALD